MSDDEDDRARQLDRLFAKRFETETPLNVLCNRVFGGSVSGA